MTPDRFAEVVRGRWIRRAMQDIAGAAIDTRELEPGQAFFAFKGEQADGHRFIGAAAERGASVAVVTDEGVDVPGTIGVLLVDDTERAIVRFAEATRATLEDTRVVAVTGSAGKTTTTRLLGQVLEQSLAGVCARKSHNNRLGISLTMTGAKPDDDYLVCEVGTSSPGEIDEYGSLVRPHIGVVTSFGREHLEGFGDLDGVADEAAALFAHIQPGGVAIVDASAGPVLERAPHEIERVTIGASADADVRIDDIRVEWDRTRFTIDGQPFVVTLPGVHNAHNAAIVVVVARRFAIDDAEIADALASARGPEMRFEQTEIAGVRVINDAYNAHPDSMLASIETFAAIDPSGARRVAVLGDMLELGDHTVSAHREVADRLIELNAADLIVAVGDEMARLADRIGDACEVVRLPAPDAARAAEFIEPGDLVLLKGSRGMRLERVVDALNVRGQARGAPTG